MSDTSTSTPVEKLVDSDKLALDNAKHKKDLALEKARAALAMSETEALKYDNFVLQLALKYNLKDGDTLNESGEINRITQSEVKGEKE